MTSSDSFSEEKLENSDTVKRLYRNVADLARRLDNVLKQATCLEDLFTTEIIVLRVRLRDCCEKLMFYDPLNHGKKAEDLLWRKVYYDVVNAAKKLRKGTGLAANANDLSLQNHLTTGTGTYHHLMFRIQTEFGLSDGAADFLYLSDVLVPRNERRKFHFLAKVNCDPKKKEWAASSFQRCLICLGDLARYKQDLFGNSSTEISERYYAQAAACLPVNGMPHNQQGTLCGTSNFGCDAAYHYMRCLASKQSFEGSEGNLERVFDRVQKLLNYSQELCQNEGTMNLQQKELAVKRYLTRFMLFCSNCFFEEKEPSSIHLEQLCQQVLQDLYDCMQMPLLESSLDNDNSALGGLLLFRVVIMALMCVNHLVSKERSNQSAAIAFTLALFSHLLQHLVSKLQRILGVSPNKIENTIIATNPPPTASFSPHRSCRPNGDSTDLENNSQDQLRTQNNQNPLKKKMKRRRRKMNYCLSLEDSDLSEGEHSDDGSSDSEEGNHASDISEEGLGCDGEASSSEDELVYERNEGSSSISGNKEKENHMNGEILIHSPIQLPPKGINDEKNISCIKHDYSQPKIKSSKTLHKGKTSRRHYPPTPRRILSVIEGETLLAAVKICMDWLRCQPNILMACAQGSQLLWSRLATLLNMVSPVLHIENKEGSRSELYQCLTACNSGNLWEQQWPLPEDVALQGFPLLQEAHEQLQFSMKHCLWLSTTEKAIFRIACLHQFGLLVTKYAETNLSYDTELRIFKKAGDHGSMNGVAWPATDQEHKEAVEIQRKQLMENMAHLWLQAEVTELESKVKLSSIPHLSPYLVVTTAVLVDHMAVLRLLLFSKRFIVVIPSCVIQHLDLMKKESLQAREAIRWLEAELLRGNRYLRAQKQHEHTSLSPMKYPKRKDKEVWDFFQILECCSHLVQQRISNNASSSLVTLLIGQGDQKSHEAEKGTWNLEAIVQSAGIKMERIDLFLSQWQDSSKGAR